MLYTGKDRIGQRLDVVDPYTGKEIWGVGWADTEWGMLKLYVKDPSSGGLAYEVIGIEGRKQRVIKTLYVRRDFDLVHRGTGKVLHKIRIVNGQAVEEW
jgi:hypothetical protein